MYCSACGNFINQNLNYCNACGAKIGKGELQQNASPVLPITVGLVGMFGLFGFIRLLQILLNSALDQIVILAIFVLYLVTLFLICGVLVGQIWKRPVKTNADSERASEDYAPPKQFRADNTNQLEPPREPFIGSVTENTTRTFDKVPRTER